MVLKINRSVILGTSMVFFFKIGLEIKKNKKEIQLIVEPLFVF